MITKRTFVIKCTGCGAECAGRDEHAAEVQWGMHKCVGKRDLKGMPLDILRKLAYRTITRADAWKMTDARRALIAGGGK